ERPDGGVGDIAHLKKRHMHSVWRACTCMRGAQRSLIAGMPVLRVWEAADVVVFKRSMATGYARVQNPLLFRGNTQMLFGDAKDRVDDILAVPLTRRVRVPEWCVGCSPTPVATPSG
ncbi:MAG: NAD(P)(+) transhydrogenase (Re/Si-specific) subunit beta, partial [Dermatophilaceae bacterium]